MSSDSTKSGRLKLGLVALVFVAPLIVAAWMFYGDSDWQPVGRTNHGHLFEPIVNLNELPGQPPLTSLAATEGRWLLIYANAGACLAPCREALYRMRQSRLMLGNDMTRVARIFLHGDIGPDKVWLDEEHKGLIIISNAGLNDVLNLKRPGDLGSGGLFLVDPLGNLVMYFAADLAPGKLVDDIERLLALSHIG